MANPVGFTRQPTVPLFRRFPSSHVGISNILAFVWLSSFYVARRFGANSLSKSVLKKIPSQTNTNSSLKFLKT